jgi:hypothetical protein
MPKNYLLIYSEQLATDIELLCQNIKAPSNTLFQIRKSSSSVYSNIREANCGQNNADTAYHGRPQKAASLTCGFCFIYCPNPHNVDLIKNKSVLFY